MTMKTILSSILGRCAAVNGRRVSTLMVTLIVIVLVLSLFSGVSVAGWEGDIQYDFETGDFSQWDTVESGWSINSTDAPQGSYWATASHSDTNTGRMRDTYPSMSPNNLTFYLRVDSGQLTLFLEQGSPSTGTSVQTNFRRGEKNMSTGVLYRIDIGINWGSNTFNETITNTSTGAVVYENNGQAFTDDVDSTSSIRIESATYPDSSAKQWVDNIAFNSTPSGYSVSGYVTDHNGDPIENATVLVEENGVSDTTSGDGSYAFTLENGSYTVSASKNGFADASKTVEVDGSDVTNVNFTLERESDPSLVLDTRTMIKHNQSHPYTVREIINESGTNVSYTVTDKANVTSLNTTLLTVNETSNELVATSNENLSGVVQVRAEYNGSVSYTNVTVAEATVENLEIVPGLWRVSAVVGDDFYFFLLIATLMAVPAARYTSAFGGLAVGEMILVVGWLGGYVGFGMAAVSVFISLFIGLNLAANINYTAGRFDRG